MAGASISVEYDDRAVINALQGLIDAGADMKTAFSDIGEYLRLAHDDRFEAQESPDGTPWEPLNPKYAARKKKNADKILILDEFLRDTLAYEADADGVEFGSNRIYAATHQFGADDRGIPARPFLGISDDDEAEILEILRDFLADSVSG